MRLHRVAFIAREDLKQLLRGREALLWLFVMPVVFFYFIGTVTKGGGAAPTRQNIALVAPADAGFLVDEVGRRLEEADFGVHRPATPEEAATWSRRIDLPAGFTETVLAGDDAEVELHSRASALSAEHEKLRVGRALYTVLADVVATLGLPEGTTPVSLEALRATPRTLTVRVETAGERVEPPSGYEQSVPGILVMFTLLVLLTTGAASLTIERRTGLLRRLASAPITRGEVVAGKWASRLGLGFVQVGFAMLAGRFLFKVAWGPDLPMVLVVLLGWAALCASLAVALGGAARTEGQAAGLGVLAANALAAIGGCWWPIEIMPGWMQSLARAVPTGWAMDALHRLVNFQAGAASALPHVVALFLTALLVGWVGVRKFRYE